MDLLTVLFILNIARPVWTHSQEFNVSSSFNLTDSTPTTVIGFNTHTEQLSPDQFNARSTVWRPLRISGIKLNLPNQQSNLSTNHNPVSTTLASSIRSRHSFVSAPSIESKFVHPPIKIQLNSITKNATKGSSSRLLATSTTVRSNSLESDVPNSLFQDRKSRNTTLGEGASELSERLMAPSEVSHEQLLAWFGQLNQDVQGAQMNKQMNAPYQQDHSHSAMSSSTHEQFKSYANPESNQGNMASQWNRDQLPAVHYASTSQPLMDDSVQQLTPSATFDSTEVQTEQVEASALFEEQIEQQIEQLRRLQNHFRQNRHQTQKSSSNSFGASQNDFWSGSNQTIQPTVTYDQSFDQPTPEVITNYPTSDTGGVTFDDDLPHSIGPSAHESDRQFPGPKQIKFTSNEAISNRTKSASNKLSNFASLFNSIDYPFATRSPRPPSVTYSQSLEAEDASYFDSSSDNQLYAPSLSTSVSPSPSYLSTYAPGLVSTRSYGQSSSPIKDAHSMLKSSQFNRLNFAFPTINSESSEAGAQINFRSKTVPDFGAIELKHLKQHPEKMHLHLLRPQISSTPHSQASGTIGGSESMRDLLRAMDAIKTAVDGVKPIRSMAGKTINDLAERMRDRMRTWSSTQYTSSFPHGFESEFEHSLRAERYGPPAGAYKPIMHPVSTHLMLTHPIKAPPSYQYASESSPQVQHSSPHTFKTRTFKFLQKPLLANRAPLSLLNLRPLLTSSSTSQAVVNVRNESLAHESNNGSRSTVFKLPIINLRYSTLPSILSTIPSIALQLQPLVDPLPKPNATSPAKLSRFNLNAVHNERNDFAFKLLQLLNGNASHPSPSTLNVSTSANDQLKANSAKPILTYVTKSPNTILYHPSVAVKGQVWPAQMRPLLVQYNSLDQAQLMKHMYSMVKVANSSGVAAAQQASSNSAKSSIPPLFEPIRSGLSRLFRQLERQLAGRRMSDEIRNRTGFSSSGQTRKYVSGSNSEEADIVTQNQDSNELNDYDRKFLEQVMKSNGGLKEDEADDEEELDEEEADEDDQDGGKSKEVRKKRDDYSKRFAKRRLSRQMQNLEGSNAEDDEQVMKTIDQNLWMRLKEMQANAHLNNQMEYFGKNTIKSPQVIYAEENDQESKQEKLPNAEAQIMASESPETIDSVTTPNPQTNDTLIEVQHNKLREKTQIEMFERGKFGSS
jgi:hypothetical protein